MAVKADIEDQKLRLFLETNLIQRENYRTLIEKREQQIAGYDPAQANSLFRQLSLTKDLASKFKNAMAAAIKEMPAKKA